MSGNALSDVLRGHLGRPEVVDEAGIAEVEALLGAAIRAATAAWPDIALATDAFIARIAHHYSNDEPLLTWLEQVRAADLYLTTACLERVPNAIETFDRTFLDAVPSILARGGLEKLPADDIRQRVRERLFVGSSKISDYSGRGALANWVQIVTLRLAIDVGRQVRAAPRFSDSTELDDLPFAGTDPELRMIKERYREPFKVALRAALLGLTSEQRNLLRMHFVERVTLDRLAEVFHVHRATIARHIATARDAVFDGVRSRLQAELGVDRAEFDDLVTLLRSRLELSLSALLPTVPP